jgi:MAP/microtubule affinity-regulating kinase
MPGHKLQETECKQLFKQVVNAVNYCHFYNICHRDIKLENILLNEDKTKAKLIGFGFSTSGDINTKTHMFCGTPSYMAPEIVSRSQYAGRPADIWALGVLLFVMITGNFPFKGSSDKEVYGNVRSGVFIFPLDAPDTIKYLIRRMLNMDPDKRPSCEDILHDPWFTEEEPDAFRYLVSLGYTPQEINSSLNSPNHYISILYQRLQFTKITSPSYPSP